MVQCERYQHFVTDTKNVLVHVSYSLLDVYYSCITTFGTFLQTVRYYYLTNRISRFGLWFKVL